MWSARVTVLTCIVVMVMRDAMTAPAPPPVDTEASLKLLQDNLRRLEYKFSKQYVTVESLKKSMVEMKDALAKAISSGVEEEKYVQLATMIKQNTNNIQNLTSNLAAALAGINKPEVQTSRPRQVETTRPPSPPLVNGEECHMQHCFKIHSNPRNRDQAEQLCQGNGGHLVMAKTADLYDFVVRLKNQHHREQQFWFGAKFTEGMEWMYPDGTPVAGAVPWARNEPNDNNNYHCSHIVFGAKEDTTRRDRVADANCLTRYPFICERTI